MEGSDETKMNILFGEYFSLCFYIKGLKLLTNVPKGLKFCFGGFVFARYLILRVCLTAFILFLEDNGMILSFHKVFLCNQGKASGYCQIS